MASNGQEKASSAATSDTGPVTTISPAAILPTREPPHIPDHELLRRIGAGSYGEVWLARNVLGQHRAVKVVYRDSFEQDKPYEREFAGIQKFEPISRAHEGHVDILHVGRNDEAGCFYYVMELADDANVAAGASPAVEPGILPGGTSSRIQDARRLSSEGPGGRMPPSTAGGDACRYTPRTLKAEIKNRGALPIDRCLEIGLALARALAHLHECKLVHRDIKPSNIIIVGGAPRLADIGLVTGIDATRSFVGTDGYIPPEGPGTPQADLYSLGKVLYEMSTGLDRQDFPELPAAWRTSEERNRLLEFNEVVLKACDSDVLQRYASTQQLESDLALLQRGQSVKRKRAWEQHRAIGRKVSLVSAILVVLTGLGWRLINDFDGSRRGKRAAPRTELPPMAGTTNLEAWKLFERGNVCFRRFTVEGEKAARALFTEAVRLDPNFVLAHNYLFACYVNSSGLPYAEAVAGMRAMAKKLREVKTDSAEAYYAQAYVDFRLDLKFAEAEKGFERALQIDPSANARSFYGCYLVYVGRPEAARDQFRRMIDFDPASPVGESLFGCSYYAERNFAEAIVHFRRALELAPGYLYQHTLMGRTHEAKGDYLGALDHFQKMELGMGRSVEELKPKYDALRQAVKESGAVGYWRVQLERAQDRSNPEDQSYEMASILAQLGRKTESLDWLEKAYARRDSMDRLLFDHYWDGLREEPRFQALLRTVGYVR